MAAAGTVRRVTDVSETPGPVDPAGDGIRVDSMDPVTVSMTVGPRDLNFLSVTHGAVVYAVADRALELAASRRGRFTAVDTHLVLTGSSRLGDELEAVAEPVTEGRTLGTYRVLVRRRPDRVIAILTGSVLFAF